MKVCSENEWRASSYVENGIENLRGVSVKDGVKEIVLDDGVSSSMREKITKIFSLVGQEVYYNSYKKSFIIGEGK